MKLPALRVLVACLLASATQGALAEDVDRLDERAEALYADGRLEEARAVTLQTLEMRREALGGRHPDVALNLNSLAYLMELQGESATDVYRQSLSILRDAHGTDHADVGHVLKNLAGSLSENGDVAGARQRYQESVAVFESIRGEDHPDVAAVLNEYGRMLKVKGHYAAARPVQERCLAIRREALGNDHLSVAWALADLGNLLAKQGEYADAQAAFEECLAIRRRGLGEVHRDVASSLNNLATSHRQQGAYAAALPLLEQSLEIYRSLLDEDDPLVAMSLNNLGSLYDDMQDYAKARLYYEESLAIRENSPREDHDIGAALNNLGTLLRKQGDFAAARPMLERSLEISVAKFGEEHPRTASTQNNLAVLLMAQGDDTAAVPLLERSLAIRRATLGNGHRTVAGSLHLLSSIKLRQGDLDGARALLEESLAIREVALGSGHRLVASNLSALARVSFDDGDYAGAIPLLEQSLAIHRAAVDEDNIYVAVALHDLGYGKSRLGDLEGAIALYEEALAITRVVVGEDHPHLSTNLSSLASALEEQGEHGSARPLRDEALQWVEGRLSLLDALSEREALAFVPSLRHTLDAWLASNDDDPEVAWEHVMRFKGAVAARARAARASATDPDAVAAVAELAVARRELARLAFSSDAEDRADRLEALQSNRDRRERDLLAITGARRGDSAADPSGVCTGLGDDTALVDLLRYQRVEELHYLAFVVRGGACEVHRLELGLAANLDEAVADWRLVLDDPMAQRSRVDARGSRVRELIWDPLEPFVGDATQVLVVPDGPLAAAPLGALPIGDGRYLLEDRALTWLDRSNDVLLPAAEPGVGALVVGAVDYERRVGGRLIGRSSGFVAPCNEAEFEPLPGTAEEASLLGERWQRWRRREPLVTLGGAEATESAVSERVRSQALVHIATHGFFATGRCRSLLEGDGGVGFDPMLLSGLALSGANVSDPTAGDDGILTAAEVSALDLSGAQLVVLSACETGLGEVRSGQGVLGLRRAFAAAGARTLIMSLWSVPDAETAALMGEMYRLYLRRRGLPAAEALRGAQLRALEAQREADDVRPGAWAAFIAAGEWK